MAYITNFADGKSDVYHHILLQYKYKLRFIRAYDNDLSHVIIFFQNQYKFQGAQAVNFWEAMTTGVLKLKNGRSFKRATV